MLAQTINIGDYKVIRDEGVLESISLGSCVGVVLYDPVTRIGGLAHIMLPTSLASPRREGDAMMSKYADVAIRSMLDAMISMGALRHRITARIAGGACMFESAMMDATMNIGLRNSEAVKMILGEEHITIVAEDVGSNYGRSLKFDVATGRVSVKSARMGV